VEKCYDEQYVRSITQMGDSHNVVTSQPIYTKNRIKLVDKGVRVNSALFERLVSHKLIPQIDRCLTVEDGVSRDSLKAYAIRLLDQDAGLSVLRGDAKIRSLMLHAFGEIPLVMPMAFKMTVARSQRPEVYDHSIRVALVALFLALRSSSFSVSELVALAAAAVFHDIGILHVPPALLQGGRRLGEAERHHLYAHPISGFLILREFSEYHPEISRTVFEHHERLDGSGYPRGLKQENICLGAQVLMLAEAANAIFERSPKAQNLSRFSVLLRLNQKKFNSELSACLLALVQDMQTDQSQTDRQASAVSSIASLRPRLVDVARVVVDWHATSEKCRATADDSQAVAPLLAIIDERIADLQRMLVPAGFDVSDPGGLIDMLQEDIEAMTELDFLLGEVRWQLLEILHEAHRRLGEMVDAVRDEYSLVLEWLDRNEIVIEQI
jgi:HD-GYP domain-containing protein (c-di-GMP phosphodiesterase class II)